MRSCFFIGHRDTPSWVQEMLDNTVAYLVEECGVRELIVGNHGSFDAMATTAVCKAKKRYPEIYARRLVCYHPTDRPLYLPDGFDDLYYPYGLDGVPARYAIVKVNQLMVDQCDYLVAYVNRSGGNASMIYNRGICRQARGEMRVINLNDNQSRTG